MKSGSTAEARGLAPEEPKKGSSKQTKDNKKYSMELAHIKHVHFDPAFEAEDEERSRRKRARQEEKKVGRDCDCTIRSSAVVVVAVVAVVVASAASAATVRFVRALLLLLPVLLLLRALQITIQEIVRYLFITP
jgi:hypothetical protein